MSSTLIDNSHVPVMKDLHINDPAKPEFISHRIKIFDRLFNTQQEEINAKERKPIQIKVPSGKIFEGIAYETTPADIAKEIKKSWQDTFVVAKVQDELWDLRRPLEESCSLELLDFENPEGQKVFWHSSAHILGEACENELCAKLCVGPPTSEGFFYEMHLDGKAILSTDLPRIEEAAKKICQEKQEFERLTISKADLLEMFKHNPFKLQIIQSKIPDGSFTTVYRCGSLIDLCRGPHVLNSGKVKAFSILKHSSSYFLGDSKNETLQRVYGISFPNTKQMSEYKKFLEEAAKRDHRKIGRDQELFFFHELSPGSCFFLPHGARIYNKLMELMKTEYHTRGYSEVVTPNIYNSKLWKTSGHWQNYAENMFQIAIEKDEFALKPMNCPGHCLMFKLRDRSWRELPWRLADFGVLHRNEFSGALTGLTRVRRFCQDDAHIFCTMEQLNDEILQCFDFLEAIYKRFGFEFHLELSTRPDKYLGAIETWNLAEAELTKALQSKFGDNWKINAGDGAFYGPKVDITIKDALRRKYQCATIQLDFQLPERFELEYTAPDGQRKRPVMIHRAILGSLERVIAILTEHFAGKWPLWLSPRQVMIVPVAAVYYDYAKSLQSLIHQAGFYVEADLSEDTMQKKVRNAQTKQFNYTCIVGQEELESQGLNVRKRGQDPKQPNSRELIHVDAFIARLKEECSQFK